MQRVRIGLFDATMVVMGGIVGSGIFVNPAVVAQIVHAPALTLVAWAAGGAVALAGAFIWAELAARLPQTGGQYAVLREALHPMAGFLYGWALLLVINAGGVAAVAVTFARYFAELVGLQAPPALLAVGAIALLAAVNCLGVKSGSAVQSALMALKIVALAALVLVGLFGAARAEPAAADAALTGGPAELLTAMVPVLFAYGGWQTASFLAGEVRDVKKTLPRALLFGTAGVVVLYVGVAAVCLRVLGAQGLAASDAPAAAVLRAALGARGATLIACAIALSTLGFLSQSLLTMPRVYFAMAADGLFFRSVARTSARTGAPVAAIVLQAIVASAVALSGRYDQILGYVVSMDWIFFGLTAVSLFVLRRRSGERASFEVPGHPFTTAAFALIAFAVAANTIYRYPQNTLVGLLLVVAGVPVFFFWRRARPNLDTA